jgi:hypothetical protein
MLTKKDFELLEKKFVTKEHFDNALKGLFEMMAQMREDLLKKFDESISELKFISLRHETRLENHEVRINAIESKV